MDAIRFDRLARSLTDVASRRGLLRGLAATLGLVAIRLPGSVEAKKKRKKKKLRLNQFGCVNVGQACKRAGQCCSGICKGKKGKKRCRAHDSGGCKAGQSDSFCGGTDVTCTTASGFPLGGCNTTTGKAGYCSGNIECQTCARDVDCQTEFGPQAACVVCSECAEGTACAGPDDLG